MEERFNHQSSGNNELNAEDCSQGLLINTPGASQTNATSKQHADIKPRKLILFPVDGLHCNIELGYAAPVCEVHRNALVENDRFSYIIDLSGICSFVSGIYIRIQKRQKKKQNVGFVFVKALKIFFKFNQTLFLKGNSPREPLE